LDWFRHLFKRALAQSEKSDDLDTRCANINDYFTFSLYSNVCRSLFERHKLLFSFMLCITMLRDKGEINDDEWRFLITGGACVRAL
jgi:dynein heavy chain